MIATARKQAESIGLPVTFEAVNAKAPTLLAPSGSATGAPHMPQRVVPAIPQSLFPVRARIALPAHLRVPRRWR